MLGGAGNFPDGDDHTDEERKMMFETRKILGDESIAISVTCARVPVTYSPLGVGQRADARAARARGRARAAAGLPGHRGGRRPDAARYPTASAAAGRDEVFVGRIRRDPSHPRALNLWVVSDNLLKGAATNAVQIAELLHERGLVRPKAAQAA